MINQLFKQIVATVAFAAVAQAANAIPFTIKNGSATTSGVSIGSKVEVTPSDTLAGSTFYLDVGQTTKRFNFLDVEVTGFGAVGGYIDAVLNFSSPIATADGVLSGFGVVLGVASGGVLTILNDPGPIAFGNGGLFDVDFFGFEDSCFSLSFNCTSLSGTVTATISLLKAPATTVPEPATLSLLGAGLLAIGLSRRRKRA